MAILLLLSALGCALIGGVFFAFSTFVMRALNRLPAAQAIAAMQSINLAVINPLFLTPFLGTAATCLASAALALVTHAPRAGFAIAASALYLVGTFAVTMVANVPLNNTLAPITPADASAPGTWSAYHRSWTRWNHVRTLAALAAATCFMLAFR